MIGIKLLCDAKQGTKAEELTSSLSNLGDFPSNYDAGKACPAGYDAASFNIDSTVKTFSLVNILFLISFSVNRVLTRRDSISSAFVAPAQRPGLVAQLLAPPSPVGPKRPSAGSGHGSCLSRATPGTMWESWMLSSSAAHQEKVFTL